VKRWDQFIDLNEAFVHCSSVKAALSGDDCCLECVDAGGIRRPIIYVFVAM
jgi:hypothetical protein